MGSVTEIILNIDSCYVFITKYINCNWFHQGIHGFHDLASPVNKLNVMVGLCSVMQNEIMQM